MTRSRLRKLKRMQLKRTRSLGAAGPLAAVMTFAAPEAQAQEPPAQTQSAPNDAPVIEELFVTAQKRTENVQDVPISIRAFGTQELEELGIKDFDDYAKYLPSL